MTNHWNRAARRSGGPRRAVIHVPPVPSVLTQLARRMVDEFNAKQDVGLTREHIRNIAESCHLDRGAIVQTFVSALGSTNELSQKIAEIFADQVLGERRS